MPKIKGQLYAVRASFSMSYRFDGTVIVLAPSQADAERRARVLIAKDCTEPVGPEVEEIRSAAELFSGTDIPVIDPFYGKETSSCGPMTFSCETLDRRAANEMQVLDSLPYEMEDSGREGTIGEILKAQARRAR